MTTTLVPKRLSVSAIRAFHRCGHYYKLSRIDKVPEDSTTHHRWAGSVVHAAFQLAYAEPVEDPAATGRNKVKWKVDNGGSIDDAMALFEMLWEGEITLNGSEDLVGYNRAQRAYEVLGKDPQLKPPALKQFAKGSTKALKADNLKERRDAWRAHFAKMLEASLEEGLAYPVIDVEREVVYQLGGVDAVGYIDLVMRHPEGGLVYADLKTGYNAPMDRELAYDDQMASYYETADPVTDERPREIWYMHMRTGQIYEIKRNEPLIRALHETAPLVLQDIADGHFLKKPGPDCSMCSHVRTCMS